jgi:hypothetical protein
MRIRPSVLALAMLGVCLAVFGLLEHQRRNRDFSDAALLARLPGDEGSCAFLNIQALRQSGLLDTIAGNRAEEEAEYQAFVRNTGFDYRQDLDAVWAHFAPDSNLFILRGRFSWDQLGSYMKNNEGKCLNGVCSIPIRRGLFLSAMPLAPGVIAIGTGSNRTVVYAALQHRATPVSTLPAEPFWIELSENYLKNSSGLPEGTRAFASAVSGAKHVFLSVSPGGSSLEAKLRATFATAQDAASRRDNLEKATGMLRTFFERDKQRPQSGDFSSTLLAGKFEQQQENVIGHWPMDLQLLQRIVSGN